MSENKKKYERDNKKSDEKIILTNVNLLIINALSFSVALGFNELITSIFDSFPGGNHIFKKAIYVLILFIISIILAYWIFKIKQKY
jgi:hypothetical protein